MENYSINNTIIDDDTAVEEEEESGWTAYLEDFSCSNGTSVISNPSLISDAAWNGSEIMIRRLKRNNHRKYSYDDDLEDTASSPVNSPKVIHLSPNDKYAPPPSLPPSIFVIREETLLCETHETVSSMKQMEVNYMKSTDDIAASGNFLGKQAISNNFWKQDREERVEKNVNDVKSMDKLRERGLCLVPMSTLINYLG
ncbi:hypothetical protein ACS0TY_017592 [Phlomoides rotata]